MLQKYTFMIVGLLMSSMLYGQKVEVIPIGDPDKVVHDLNFNKSGSRLATTDGPFVKIWDIEQQQLVQTLTGHNASILLIIQKMICWRQVARMGSLSFGM